MLVNFLKTVTDAGNILCQMALYTGWLLEEKPTECFMRLKDNEGQGYLTNFNSLIVNGLGIKN